jgi:hypothetical protein
MKGDDRSSDGAPPRFEARGSGTPAVDHGGDRLLDAAIEGFKG